MPDGSLTEHDDLFTGPSAVELIDAVGEFLRAVRNDVGADQAFELRTAINALEIVGRQLGNETEVGHEHRQALAELGYRTDAELAQSIRSGEQAIGPDLVAVLKDDAERRLTVDSPRYVERSAAPSDD
ncbi:hypothetical protein BH683_025310 [Williamsia sp. 1138]|uniref:DUF6285 domain-containing protein n=1 Tax=Williamsia sp. 1138 TaxID=1903117 RepID=UPI000A0FACD5|nr:DUF6285 domain-containing protein [Williamsia sp. 1138]OZG26134.1 hypothetical protein BH683_025310 [Williamsia sp. 1138]